MTHPIRSETEAKGSTRQRLTFPTGAVWPVETQEGGAATQPGAHELFDASLAACKALTAHWYAQQRSFPLDRVVVELERDDSHERDKDAPWYGLSLTLHFEGEGLTVEQQKRLHDVVERCPIHKLMTSTEVRITTAPFAP